MFKDRGLIAIEIIRVLNLSPLKPEIKFGKEY